MVRTMLMHKKKAYQINGKLLSRFNPEIIFGDILMGEAYNVETCLVNLDFKLAPLFLCIMFFFTNLSIIEYTLLNCFSASFLSSVAFKFLIAVLVTLC